MTIEKSVFGKIGNSEIDIYTITNKNGVSFKITNYGGIITNLTVKDKKGTPTDIVLGFDNLEQYLGDHPYFGALIGRFGNRINMGKFSLDGKEYSMVQNNGTNHLHGGAKGFDKVIWTVAKEINEENKIGLRLNYLSIDGEENYPGNLDVTVDCFLTNENELVFDYKATTDKKTIINLTHHGYFNLNGMKSDVKSHIMQIDADKMTEINDNLIPTGNIIDIKGGAFDFTKPKQIGSDIEESGGYDHNYVLNKKENELFFAAKVTDESSGIVMEVYTTEPGMQFYSSNYLDGTIVGKNGITYKKHFAYCLETQHYPDSPNHGHFPSTVLEAGETYQQKTIYKLSTNL